MRTAGKVGKRGKGDSQRRKDTTGFAFEDPSGLMQWLAPDRAVIKLVDMNDVQAKKAALAEVVDRWVTATA